MPSEPPLLDALGIILLHLSPPSLTASFEHSSRGYGLMCSRGPTDPLHHARGMSSNEFARTLSYETRHRVKRLCDSVEINTAWEVAPEEMSWVVSHRPPVRGRNSSGRAAPLLSQSFTASDMNVQDTATEEEISGSSLDQKPSFGLSPSEIKDINVQLAKRRDGPEQTELEQSTFSDIEEMLRFSGVAGSALVDEQLINDLQSVLLRISSAKSAIDTVETS